MRAKGTGSQEAFLDEAQPPSHQEEQRDPACQQLVSCTADTDRDLGFMTMAFPL